MPATLPSTEALSASEYDRRTRAVLASIEATVDRWLQDDVIDIDASRTGGLLEMRLPNGSSLVVNTQPPLQELWLAAQSGGFHFKASSEGWFDSRDGADFFARLSACASEQGGCELNFSPADASA